MRTSKRSIRTTHVAVAAIASTSLLLAACSPNNQSDSEKTMSDVSSSVASATKAAGDEKRDDAALSFKEAYVKAKPADKDMTAAFGELTNNSDSDITITKVESTLAGHLELHTVKDGEMMEAKDGFTIPAGGTLTLKPGHEHIMIMDNHDEITAGDSVTFTLVDKDGKSYEFKDVPVRVQQSGEENYGGSEGSSAPTSSASMGNMGQGDHAGHNHG
ncbi:copper chaperone PCu(A)C [Corynebacterium anserum]|uniref:copper chaperone PCu(A)C n=1 Tax=Corynebacterium anserum TaxID=2684406 RepID=UPI001FE4505E|nr:copper chaperone PCu(A)C [Corynebacterium anserum]